jgi:hypothetical protein
MPPVLAAGHAAFVSHYREAVQMGYNHASQPKIQLNKQQIIAGAVLMGVGGALALAGVAMAGTALATAFRQRVQQMDVPPSELARQHWSAVKHATGAGMDVWLKEQPATLRQPVTQL